MLKNDPLLLPAQLNGHHVPGIWQYMLPQEIFTWKMPAEREASCMSCPRVVTDNYRPDYRCCTYQPAIPNYSLGLALQTAVGKAPVRELIAGGHVLPEGSLHTPQEWYQYMEITSSEAFGNNDKLLCNMLDPKTGFCRAYAFRNSVCSTFFCIHDHGKKGFKFWESMQEIVGQIEAVLQQWSLKEVGFDVAGYHDNLNALSADMSKIPHKSGGWSRTALRKVWGKWFGREEELLAACASAISENRNRLWEIANDFELKEATLYEKRQIEQVPTHLKDEIDDSDLDDGESENALPKDLYKDLRRNYRNLWTYSDAKLVMSDRVEIVANEKDDPEARHYGSKPHELLYLTRKDAQTYDWRKFISEKDVALLEKFKRPRKVSPLLIKQLDAADVPDPAGRIAEWVSRKVLIAKK